MFPLFLKNLSFPPSRLSRKVFTTFKVRGFSSYSSPPKVSVSVWWHIDSCPVPSGFSFSKVAPSITAAVRANGITGTIRIRAYGDVVDKEALNSTNITLHYFFDDYPFPLHKTYTGSFLFLSIVIVMFLSKFIMSSTHIVLGLRLSPMEGLKPATY